MEALTGQLETSAQDAIEAPRLVLNKDVADLGFIRLLVAQAPDTRRRGVGLLLDLIRQGTAKVRLRMSDPSLSVDRLEEYPQPGDHARNCVILTPADRVAERFDCVLRGPALPFIERRCRDLMTEQAEQVVPRARRSAAPRPMISA